PPGPGAFSCGTNSRELERVDNSSKVGIGFVKRFRLILTDSGWLRLVIGPKAVPRLMAVNVEGRSPSGSGFLRGESSAWCPGRDSNSHALWRRPLKTVCLPVPPPGREQGARFVAPLPGFFKTTSWA